MKIYYINMDEAVDRRQFMEEQFGKLGLSATRVSGVGVQALDQATLLRYCDAKKYQCLVPEEIACTSSHLKAMRHLLSSEDEYALIIEDDVVLSPALPEFLEQWQQQKPGIDLARLETFVRFPVLLWPEVQEKIAGTSLHRPAGYADGAAAYIISRRGALAVVSDTEVLAVAIDGTLNNPQSRTARNLTIRHVVPGLCVQAQNHPASALSFSSSLEDARERRGGGAHRLRRRAFAIASRLQSIAIGRPRAILQMLRGARRVWIPFADTSRRSRL